MKKKIVSLLFIAAIAFATGCNQQDGTAGDVVSKDAINNPASANGGTDEASMPVMTFDKEKHDFGQITEGEIVSYSFRFTNTGKSPLVISHASATCGCTIPKYTDKPVQPGEKGFIEVTFNSSNKAGLQEKKVTVIANTTPTDNYITITADVKTK